MKKLLTVLILCCIWAVGFSQDFSKNIASARKSYAAGDLEDARFAMQQMLNDLDVAIGKEVLKMLPAKMGVQNVNAASDNVTANTGLAGVVVHRDYGAENKKVNVDLMSNSPLVASINAILSIPFMANSGDGTQKVIKVNGYKGTLQKTVDEQTSKTDYTVQVPIGSSLLTLTARDTTEEEVTRMASSIPLAEITKMVQ
jgi:hypothetical protein